MVAAARARHYGSLLNNSQSLQESARTPRRHLIRADGVSLHISAVAMLVDAHQLAPAHARVSWQPVACDALRRCHLEEHPPRHQAYSPLPQQKPV